MSQSLTCLTRHREHLELYQSGIWICRLCANKNEMAQSARTKLLLAKMAMGMTGVRTFTNGKWMDL